MALLWADGGAQYGDSAAFDLPGTYPGFWTTGFGSGHKVVSPGRGGIGKFISPGTANHSIQSAQFAGGSTGIVGFWYEPDTLPASDTAILQFIDTGATVNCHIMQNNGVLMLRAGATAAGTLLSTCSSGLLLAGQYIECKVFFNGSTGTCDWQINGSAAGSDTGLDTLAGVADFDRIRIGRGAYNSSADENFTDMYCADTTGSDLTDFAGDSQVLTEFVNAEGSNIDFTPSTGTDNSANADEVGHDSDTTYNESNTVGHQDNLDLADLVAAGNTVHGLIPFVAANKQSAGAREIGVGVDSNGTEGGLTAQALSTSYEYFFEVLEQDPDTAAAWAVAAANAAEMVYKVVS